MVIGELQQGTIREVEVDAALQHDGPRDPETARYQYHTATFPMDGINGGLDLAGVQGETVRYRRIFENVDRVLFENGTRRKGDARQHRGG